MSTTEQTEHSTRGSYVHAGEEYNRDTSYIEDRIVAAPAAAAQLDPDHQLWPVMPGAYRLVAAPPLCLTRAWLSWRAKRLSPPHRLHRH